MGQHICIGLLEFEGSFSCKLSSRKERHDRVALLQSSAFAIRRFPGIPNAGPMLITFLTPFNAPPNIEVPNYHQIPSVL